MTGVSARARWSRASIVAAGLLIGWGLYATGLFAPPLIILPAIGVNVALNRRKPRPAFLVDGRTFSAIVVRWFIVADAAAIACTLGMLGYAQRDPDLSSAFGTIPLAVLLTAMVVVGLRFAWRTPGVVLTPDALILQRLFFTRTMSWDSLAGPVVVTRWEGVLTVAANGVQRRTLLGRLETDHRFLADAIEHYRTHPADRASIGTFEGHQRLDAALRAWHAAYWQWRAMVTAR